MDRYYYLVAQLPTLRFDRETDLTGDGYLREAQKWLRAADYAVLAAVDMNDAVADGKRPRVLRDYAVFEYRLRHDLVRWRQAARSGQAYRPLHVPLSALEVGNPLEVEKNLLRLRWDFIAARQREYHFDLAFLVLYFLQLQILRRLSVFDGEAGLQRFRSLCARER